MRSPSPAFFAACLCVAFAGGCAMAHDGDELKSIFDQGVAAYDAGHYEEAFRLFQSIDSEDVAAMRNEGLMLRKGLGTAKDPQAAEDMLGRAAEAGPPDPKAALPLLTQAASAHHPIAEYRLGVFYEEGTLVEKNLGFARTLYTDAAGRGVPEAKERLAKLGGPVPAAPPAGAPNP